MSPEKFSIALALLVLFFGAYAATDRLRGKPRGWKSLLFRALVGVSFFYLLLRYVGK